MPKYRIIERNDGKYQYEFGYKDNYSELTLWNRVEHMLFATEEAARFGLYEILDFCNKAGIKRVVDELEVKHE